MSAQTFGTGTDDAKMMKKATENLLGTIAKKAFDFGNVQGNTGIHELRRELRWVGYYNKIANMDGPDLKSVPDDLLQFADTANDALSDIKERGEQVEEATRLIVQQQGIPYDQALTQAFAPLGPEY